MLRSFTQNKISSLYKEVTPINQELLSKKELLEQTGISYGQLYRWKRKNLIPEDWFIRKSTFTGQETFFPKQEILHRVNKILSMKDDLSLDELADMFSPIPLNHSISRQSILSRNIVTPISLQLYEECFAQQQEYPFEIVLSLYTVDQLLLSGECSQEEAKTVLRTYAANYASLQGKATELILVRKMGMSICLLTISPDEIYWEEHARIVARLSLPVLLENLKQKWDILKEEL
ncbi:YhbD family protein [Brevibacillus laterosporus]|uniref:YhbD family protein n=1 Tax=Brevibacillus laterosporus TaxID=1465 RepID=UPI00159579C0|nr:YhbD family protein [Brevibacillus laterosporus]